MPLSTTAVAYIHWFADLGLDDIPLVGGVLRTHRARRQRKIPAVAAAHAKGRTGT